MGFGNTAKKIQNLASLAEKTYEKMNEVVTDLERLREDFEATSDRVATLEREVAEQRAIVEAIAEREGVDVDAVVADVAGPTTADATDGRSDGDAGTAEGTDDT